MQKYVTIYINFKQFFERKPKTTGGLHHFPTHPAKKLLTNISLHWPTKFDITSTFYIFPNPVNDKSHQNIQQEPLSGLKWDLPEQKMLWHHAVKRRKLRMWSISSYHWFHFLILTFYLRTLQPQTAGRVVFRTCKVSVSVVLFSSGAFLRLQTLLHC